MPCFTSEKTRVFVVSEPRRRKYNPQIPIGKGLMRNFHEATPKRRQHGLFIGLSVNHRDLIRLPHSMGSSIPAVKDVQKRSTKPGQKRCVAIFNQAA
jgi:hypothetical protein